MRTAEKTLSLDEWQRLKTQIFWCYEGYPPMVGSLTRYRTPNYSLWFVQRGQATVYRREQPVEVRTGDCVLIPPPRHERSFTEDILIMSVHFRLAWLDDIDLFTLHEPLVFPATRHPALARSVRRLLRFFHSFGPRSQMQLLDPSLTLAQYLHFQTLCGRFALTLTNTLAAENALPPTCCDRPNPQLAPILARLRALPLDRPWNSVETAQSLGMSTGHFNRVFRQEFGQTPRRYFDTRRLEHAKRGVVTANVSIKEVAAQVGFTSAVFCRWFRQAVGASPSVYRRNIGQLRTR